MNHPYHQQGDRKPKVQAIDIAGRVPPHNEDAEAAVLSAVLTDSSVLDDVRAVLPSGEPFYSDAHRRIYDAACTLHDSGKPVDIQTVAGVLKDRERLQAIGGITYLVKIADATPSVAHVVAHAEIVREKWLVRRFIETSQMVAAEGFGDYGSAQEWFNNSVERFSNVADDRLERRDAVLLYDVMKSAVAAYGTTAMLGTKTGFVDVDHRTGGLRGGELIIVAGRPGMGKAIAVDERVLTPRGWRRMGDLAVGDLVIGASGKPTRVLGVYDQGERDAFRLTMDDGCSVIVDDEHLWLTRNRSERRRDAPGRVRTTREIRHTLERAVSGGLNHSIRYVDPVEFDNGGERPIDPWLLGVILGDGCTVGGLTITNPEPDIRERVAAALRDGDRVTPRSSDPNDFGIAGGATKHALRELGVDGCRSWEKFIPRAYLFAPIEDRVALLHGLCDTDGFVTTPGRRSVEFCTASETLADDVEFLVRSLGGTVSKRVRTTHYVLGGERHDARPSVRMVLAFPTGAIVPVSSRKHLAKWQHGPHRITERFIANVEPVGTREMRCIRVDAPDSLYVTEGFIVTHNTAYVMDIATNVASIEAVPYEQPLLGVMVFSLEMPKEQLANRMIASEARISLTRFRKNELFPAEWERMVPAANRLGELPVYIDDTPAISLTELRAKVRKQQHLFDKRLPAREGETDTHWKQRIGLIIIDYLQLMRGRDNLEREQQVSEISRGLKALAKELDVPVIALSQLNRAVETRSTKDKRPQMSDLRESGAIEQDADMIQFVYRPEYYIADKESAEARKYKGYAEVIIAKQRNGATGRVPVTFIDEYVRFENRARDAWRDEDD